jgi:glycosyltransferase involved in cell wall biosynthesis
MDEFAKANIPAHYIPHGVELDTFKPFTEAKKRKLRESFGVPRDAFVVGMVAANQDGKFPTRKGFERILPAIANHRKKGLDNLYLYIHTLPGRELGGVPLIDVVKAFGAQDYVFLPRPGTFEMGGLSREELAELYNVFNLYACPSMAEGFGLPLIEAQACGIPVIATNFSACRELCTSEWLIKPSTYIMTPLFSFQALPSIVSIENRIEYAYNHPAELKKEGKKAVEFAKSYNWDIIVQENWLPMLEKFADRIENENKFGEFTQDRMPQESDLVEDGE